MADNTESKDGFDTRPSPRPAAPDAHGQAALILAESILHALMEARALTFDQAVSVIQTACEVKIDVADETGEPRGTMEHSLSLLANIERSLTLGKYEAATADRHPDVDRDD